MKSKLVGLLFALPFLGVGIFATFLLVMDLHDAWRMRDWVTVPATLESAGYSTSAGEDAGTYKAYARYRYKVDGVRYRNDRVSISGGIGAGVLSATLRSSGRVDTQHAAATSQPWLLRPAWQHNGIRSSSRSTMWMAWGFATLWSLISAPLPFLVFEEVQQKGNTLAWLGLLFPLVGAGLIIAALQRTREWRRFGRAPLILDPFPGADLDRDYEIPVYATKAGSAALPGHSIDIARAGQRERDLAAVQALFESKFTTSGRALFYPMGRHPAFGIPGSIFGSVFTVGAYFIVTRADAWVMATAFAAVGMLILLASLYFMLNSLEIRQDGADIVTIRRLLGIQVGAVRMPRVSFSHFDKVWNMSTQSGSRHVMYYTLKAIDRSGRAMTVGEGFKGAGQANAAADFIAAEFGLTARSAAIADDGLDLLATD